MTSIASLQIASASAMLALLVGCAASDRAAQAPAARIPFPDALADCDVRVDSLASILDDALIIGNGDVNALVWAPAGATSLMLTKNDVWDARLDMSNEPPLPTLQRILEVGRSGRPIGEHILPEGHPWSGKDSYHSRAYPCPRACARITLGTNAGQGTWEKTRAEGEINEWKSEGKSAAMSIAGRPGASAGYALGGLKINTNTYPQLKIRLSGTANARFFVEATSADGGSVLASGWRDTPTEPQETVFDLPPDREIAKVILYAWTRDGKAAVNRFEAVTFRGKEADFSLDLKNIEPPKRPARLDITRAVARIGSIASGEAGEEIRALAQRNVILIKSPAPLELRALKSADLPPAEEGRSGTTAWLRQTIPGDLDWPGMQFAVAAAQRGGQKAVAVVTSLESRDPLRDAIALAEQTTKEDESVLIAEHEAIWREFWSKSGIEISDATLRQAWYRSLYFLRCVSKPGSQCPGLFAGLVNDTPAWHGDYHTNYNIQQTFWAAYAANHPELAEPYDRLIKEYLPRAQWLARQIFSMNGAFYPHVLFAYEPPDPAACKSPVGRQYIHHVWGMTLGVTGFTVQPVWWHYKYAPDREFLRNTAYPLVREAALFYAEFIEKCEGGDTVRLGPTVSPEHWGWTPCLKYNYNCAFDIAMVRYILNAAVEGAETLGCDAALAERFRKAQKRLPPYPIGQRDGLPVVVDVEGAPPIEYNIAVPATPVFPCDVVTWRSPAEELALFSGTIGGLRWNGNNSTVMLAVARARLNMHDTQEWLREEIKARLRPNGTLTLNRRRPHHHFNDFGHYTEQFGVGMAVSELLLQSVGDVIRILPALDSGTEAKFVGLRTQGGFLVSASGSAQSVDEVIIESTVGGPLRLLCPWAVAEMTGPDGRTSTLSPDGEGIITIMTQPGQKMTLRPQTAGK